jgi:hypothetical protein
MADSVDLLRELKSKERFDDLSRMSCDILRAMTVLGGSAWESDLDNSLRMIWSLRQKEDTLGTALVAKALQSLQDQQILKVQKRIRGELTSGKATEEAFYQVCGWFTLLRIFGSDKEVVLSRGRY